MTAVLPQTSTILACLGQAAFVWDIATDSIAWSDHAGAVFNDITPEALASGAEFAKLIEPKRSVRSEALTFLVAGHETTSTALTWTWFLLGSHPSIRQRVREEVGSVLGDRPPTVEDVQLLVDESYSQTYRVGDGVDYDLAPLDGDRAGVGLIDAARYLHQR